MGLWNFLKGAGKSLIGGDESPDADALKKEVADLGLDAEGLDITVEGDKVKVSGDAVSQEMREKVILAVGNVEGVAAVEDEIPARSRSSTRSRRAIRSGRSRRRRLAMAIAITRFSRPTARCSRILTRFIPVKCCAFRRTADCEKIYLYQNFVKGAVKGALFIFQCRKRRVFRGFGVSAIV